MTEKSSDMRENVPADRRSGLAQLVGEIRNDIFKMADGEFMGSEEDLLARYRTSRPTLRRATSLLSQERLLTSRRGVNGGFFARRPDIGAVSHMVALYLRSHDVAVSELIRTMLPIRSELARLAAASTDVEARYEMATFLEQERNVPAVAQSFADFTEAERTFNSLLGKMSGNKTLQLYLEILLDLSAMVHREMDIYRNDPERLAAYRRARDRLADAVMDHEGDIAAIAARRCFQLSSGWAMRNLAEQGAGGVV